MTGIYNAYLFTINKNGGLDVKSGHIHVKTMSSTAVFYPKDKLTDPVFCSKEEGILYNKAIWYKKNEKTKNKDILMKKAKAKLNNI